MSTQRLLSPEAVRQARLPVREGGPGLPSAVDISGPAFIEGQALVLARAIVMAKETGLSQALSDLANTPHAKGLSTKPRELPSFASGQQIAEIMGTSYAALAMNQEPAKRGEGTLLVEAGASGTSPANLAHYMGGTGQPKPPPPEPDAQQEDTDEPSLGAKPVTNPTRLHHAQSRITKALHSVMGTKLLADLKAQANDIDNQRAYKRFTGARGKGAMAWATCQGIEPWEHVTPDISREILARNLGSHDGDAAFGAHYHEGCDTASTPVHTMTCAGGGMQTHTHQALLSEFLTRSMRDCKIRLEVESSAPFRRSPGPGQGNLRMDVVTYYGAMFRAKASYNPSALLFDVTITNPLGPTALARARTRPGLALEEAMKAKHSKYGAIYRPT